MFLKSLDDGEVKLTMIQDIWIRSPKADSNKILEAGGTLPCWRMRSMIRTNFNPEESITDNSYHASNLSHNSLPMYLKRDTFEP